MAKRKRAKQRKRPFYKVFRLDGADALEALLNELREEGFVVSWVMCGIETYTVVALMPDL